MFRWRTWVQFSAGNTQTHHHMFTVSRYTAIASPYLNPLPGGILNCFVNSCVKKTKQQTGRDFLQQWQLPCVLQETLFDVCKIFWIRSPYLLRDRTLSNGLPSWMFAVFGFSMAHSFTNCVILTIFSQHYICSSNRIPSCLSVLPMYVTWHLH